MAIQIISGSGNNALLTIDSTSNAARATLYGADGTEINKVDRANAGITPGTTRGIPLIGVDHKTPTLLRCSSDGSLLTGDRTLLLYDRMEGAAYNSNKWIQSLTTMTMTQTSSALLFNANSTTTTTTGAMLLSHRFMPVISRSSLVFRCRALHSAHTTNNLIEMGFGSSTSATSASLVNGVVWRKDGSGNYTPIISINGTETTGTPISNATFIAQIPTTAYAIFEVQVNNNKAYFSIYKTTGEMVFFQSLDFGTTSTGYQQTRLQAMLRLYNSGAASPAVQMTVDDISVWMSDFQPYKIWGEQLAGSDQSIQNNPTTYAILEQYTNNSAPTVGTPTNTTNVPGAALGGQSLWNSAGTSFAASESLDLIIFCFQIPSPYGLMIKGIRLDSLSQGAANGAAIYTIEWFLAINGSAVSLATAAPYAYRRKYLGFQTVANGAAAGTQFSPTIDVRFQNGLYVYPSRYVVVGARVIGASVGTSGQQIRTDVSFDGYFE